MGNPSEVESKARLHERLIDAYRRYERAFDGARPGTAQEVDLVRARIDLTLLLQTEDEPLPEEVLSQLVRDANKLLSVSPPLP